MHIVVIGGAQRSGTTLVQTLIANAMPDAPILPEAHILCDLLHAWKRAKSEWLKTSCFYDSESEAADFFRSTTTVHIDDIRKRYGNAKNLVLKDPNFIAVLPEIAEILPRTTTIVCVRDPRDIVASFLKIGERQAVLHQETKYSRREIDFVCKKINASYQPLVDGPLPTAVTLVRYEDIVANPAAALDRLAKETGLPLALHRLDNLVWLEDEYRHQETWRTELEGKPPTAESVGSFRHLLGGKELAQVEKTCRPLLQRFSYAPEPHQRTIKLFFGKSDA